jgi:hypothetical protein
MFKMGVDPETTKAPKPVPGDQWYKLKLKGLKCKLNKAKDSYNFNAEFEVVENKAEFNGTKIYFLMPTKGSTAGRKFVDFCHALGLPLNDDGTLPGTWDHDMKTKVTYPGGGEGPDPEKSQYRGPLLGRVAHAEVVVDSWEGQENNKIKQFKCLIDGCVTKYPDVKHMTNLVGKDNK